MRWWNEEVKCAVRRKKVLYRRLLDTGTEEAKQLYKEAKLEAKKVVRNAKNEEWEQLGKELEKDARGNQRSFWARVNGSRRSKESMAHIYNKNGEVLSKKTEAGGGRSTLKGCSKEQMDLTRTHHGDRFH